MPEGYIRGLAMRRSVLGDAYADGVENAAKSDAESDEDVTGHLATTFTRLATEHAWGAVWPRPQIEARTRSILTIGILIMLGNQEELALHFRAALRNKYFTRDELYEVILQACGYAGYPMVLSALKQLPDED